MNMGEMRGGTKLTLAVIMRIENQYREWCVWYGASAREEEFNLGCIQLWA